MSLLKSIDTVSVGAGADDELGPLGLVANSTVRHFGLFASGSILVREGNEMLLAAAEVCVVEWAAGDKFKTNSNI